MGYSDEDFGPNENDITVWKANTVYYDDEIVEYQGKHYTALKKTSAEVPGRSKPGIWKEIIYNTEQSPMGLPEYDGDIYDEHLPDFDKKSSVSKKAPEKSEESSTKQSPVTSPRPINKPLLKKQTLKERAQEKEALHSSKPVQNIQMPSSTTKKMEILPSEQALVNSILKEMEFKKIKGFNADDSNICKNLILPQTQAGAKLEWNSSHLDIISKEGKVFRPDDGNDVAVNLSLTVRMNTTSATRFYTLWVKAQEKVLSDKECVDLVYEKLDFSYIKGANASANAIKEDLDLLTHGLHDTEIFWASQDSRLLDETGRFYKNNVTKTMKLRLYAIIVKKDSERLKRFDLLLNV